ncbi:hypothetical protein PV762_07300 [Mitsuaria sp. CC2]|uniref:hypothetical protein n=1 Tax=Mitsuaria sp. CC2 TaxID=3029186 RepID=UPI003B8AF5B5
MFATLTILLPLFGDDRDTHRRVRAVLGRELKLEGTEEPGSFSFAFACAVRFVGWARRRPQAMGLS